MIKNVSTQNTRSKNILKILLSGFKINHKSIRGFAGMTAIISSTLPKGVKAEINLLSNGTGRG